MKRSRGYVIPLALSALTAFQAGPAGADGIFLRLDDIKGEVTVQGYKENIDVLAWSWQLSQPVVNGLPQGARVRPIKIEKKVDTASAPLYLRLLKGTPIAKGELVVTRTAEQVEEEVVKLALTDVIVSGVATGAEANTFPLTESVSLTFTEACFTYMKDTQNTVCIKGGDIK